MTIFQTCYVAADGSLQQEWHDDTDTITFRASPLADLRIDQNGVAWINGYRAVQTTGAFCAALHPTAPELYVQRGNSGFVDVYNFADFTTPARSYAEPYVAQAALLRVNPDGTPLMNTSERNGRVVAGVALSGWIEERGWIAGLADNGLPGGCVFLQKPDGSAWMWSPGHDIQRPIELAVSADGAECWIAVSDVNPPKPSEIVSLMVPYVLAGPQPEPIPPSVIIPFTAWILDTEAILTPRGNGISTSDGPGPNYGEDALWVTPAMEPTLEWIYWGPEPPRGGVSYEVAYTTALAMALRNGCPVCVCDEWGEAPTQKWIGKFLTAGARAAWMVEAYRPAGEPIDQYRMRLRARLQLAGSFYAVIPPYYQQQGGGSEASSIDTLNVCREELARKATPPIVIDGFGLRRHPRSAAREADLAAWIAACPQPRSLRVPPAALANPRVTGITPPPIYKPACYAKATLHGVDLATVDAVLISNGEFVIVRTTPTTIEGFVTFRGPGVMQLVVYVAGQPAPNFFFTVS